MTKTPHEIDELIRNTSFMWSDSVIHAFVAGSDLHGATGHKPGDLDIAGVYIQPVEMVLGIPLMRENEEGKLRRFDPDTQVWSTASDDRKNTAKDVDVAMYSLRKWAGMAASGNPTALEFLFAPNAAIDPFIWNLYIVPNTAHFVSKRAGYHFIRYSEGMLRRLEGEGTGRHGQRPELQAKFGYDTKAAMHMLRVLQEGIELMNTGIITVPRPEVSFLKNVRNGEFIWSEIKGFSDDLFRDLDEAQEKSYLPDLIDRDKISSIITRAQLDFWELQ